MSRMTSSGGRVATRIAEYDVTGVLDGRPMRVAMEYQICVLSTTPECQVGSPTLPVVCECHPAVTER